MSIQNCVETVLIAAHNRLRRIYHIVSQAAFLSIHLISKIVYLVTLIDTIQPTPAFLFLNPLFPYFPLALPALSLLTSLPPSPSFPHLMPNGGISLQPPGLVLLFCSGRAHFMQYDYISLAAIQGG